MLKRTITVSSEEGTERVHLWTLMPSGTGYGLTLKNEEASLMIDALRRAIQFSSRQPEPKPSFKAVIEC